MRKELTYKAVAHAQGETFLDTLFVCAVLLALLDVLLVHRTDLPFARPPQSKYHSFSNVQVYGPLRRGLAHAPHLALARLQRQCRALSGRHTPWAPGSTRGAVSARAVNVSHWMEG